MMATLRRLALFVLALVVLGVSLYFQMQFLATAAFLVTVAVIFKNRPAELFHLALNTLENTRS